MMLLPDAVNRGLAQPLCFRHPPVCSNGSRSRGTMQSRFHHGADLSGRHFRLTPRTGAILFQSCQTQSQKTLPPKLNGRPRCTQGISDVLVQDPIRCHRDDPRSNHLSIREISTTHPCIQRDALFRNQYYKI